MVDGSLVCLEGNCCLFESLCVRVLCMSVLSRSCSADSNARTEMIWIFLGLLVLSRAEYLLHKGQNINREAACSHCHRSGCYPMTVSTYFLDF